MVGAWTSEPFRAPFWTTSLQRSERIYNSICLKCFRLALMFWHFHSLHLAPNSQSYLNMDGYRHCGDQPIGTSLSVLLHKMAQICLSSKPKQEVPLSLLCDILFPPYTGNGMLSPPIHWLEGRSAIDTLTFVPPPSCRYRPFTTTELPLFFYLLATFKREEKGRRSKEGQRKETGDVGRARTRYLSH